MCSAIKREISLPAAGLLAGIWLFAAWGCSEEPPAPQELLYHENRYPNGVLQKTYATRNGLMHDTVRYYDSAGHISEQIPFCEGNAEGMASGFFPDGSLRYLAKQVRNFVCERIVFNETGKLQQYRKWEKPNSSDGIKLVQYIDFTADGLPDLRRDNCLYYRIHIADSCPHSITLHVDVFCPVNRKLKMVTGQMDTAFVSPPGILPDTFDIQSGENRISIKRPASEKEIRGIILLPDTQRVMQTGQTKAGYERSYFRLTL